MFQYTFPRMDFAMDFGMLYELPLCDEAVLITAIGLSNCLRRSMFLDGGLHIFKLNALTDAKEFDEIMDDKIPGSGEPEHTEELLVSGNQLIVSAHASEPPKGKWKLNTVRCWVESGRANRSRPWQWESEDPKRIIVIDIPTGKVLWPKDTTLAPITLRTGSTFVYTLFVRSGEECSNNSILAYLPGYLRFYPPFWCLLGRFW